MGWLMKRKKTEAKKKTAPPVTEEQRKAARKAEIEYANFLEYDGSEQTPIDVDQL